MNEVAKCVLQALILMFVATLSRKKPEDLEMEIPEGYAGIQNLGQEERVEDTISRHHLPTAL